ncbi:helix-turn-helix domain-containing protein [Nonomuraea aurantiaca]|uniref:helix-turn-helix domain-containing protein n=1 Tax=Nonomuraea aurantiaca TaxID=2878562 RepID=UPI001CDA168D|nr:pyridoxamine 5'-phosphate oxidase family protein [Nonomuraea aurantiaca]MCA2229221.1 pyridoxamine 5'-phosphate oxidase family protein [Nonomuraea aurantiaca]
MTNSDITNKGDFARRISHHRVQLGLTLDQVAARADMSAGYVQYLEGHLGTPDANTIARLARALETTPQDLLGGNRDRPPGPSDVMHAPAPETLDPEECLRLIAPGGIGRVAFNGSQGPTVLPVNYRYHDGAVVFRTAHGGPMDQDLRTGLTGVEIKIGFEVDRIDEAQRAGWSVLVQGPAHHVPEDEAPGTDVEPWAGGDRHLYIRIVPCHVTGRRIHAL